MGNARFSPGKIRRNVKEETVTEQENTNALNKAKSKEKSKKSGDSEELDITSMYIKDGDGNIERHDVEVVHRRCSFNAGDYLPGNKSCDAPCPMRSLCANNAVAMNRIQINEEALDDFREEASRKFPAEYEKLKKDGKLVNVDSKPISRLKPKKGKKK